MTIRHDREPQLIDAITELKSDAIVSIVADGSIVWGDENPTNITEKQISDKLAVLVTEYDSQAYARKRKIEYDALNQLEMQFDDKEDGTTTWEDAIKAIKTKYPKG